MSRPSRFRRVAKWTGVGVCVLLLVAWGVSWGSGNSYGPVHLHRGGFAVHDSPFGMLKLHAEFRGGVPSRMEWWPIWFRANVNVGPTPIYASGVFIPFWMPSVLIAIPTARLFWRDRKRPPGHCQRCGYNLRGLTVARCPECATEFDPATVPEE